MCDSLERHRFMRRLYDAANKDYECSFITGEPLVKLFSIFNDEKCIFVRQNRINLKPTCDINKIHSEAEKSIEVLNGEVDLQDAIAQILSVLNKINKSKAKPDLLIIWNGQQILGRALTLYAQISGCETSYLELSNLPNKIFCDKEGVNALSSLAKDIRVLNKYSILPDEAHNKWIDQYILQKQKPLPQSIKNKKHMIFGLVNRVLKFFFQGVGKSKINANELLTKKKIL